MKIFGYSLIVAMNIFVYLPPTIAAEENKSPPQVLTVEDIVRYEQLARADRLYLSGAFNSANLIYREVKKTFAQETERLDTIAQPIYDPTQLTPSAAVYWRMYGEGIQQDLQSKILVPSQLLSQEYPEFIPGHIYYAQALQKYGKDREAANALQEAFSKYPSEPELVKAKIAADVKIKNWLEASISARQFALFNSNHPQATEFIQLADENLQRYQDDLNSRLTTNAIGGILTGVLGYIATGSLFGPFSALDTTILLLQGESGVGKSVTKDIVEKVPLLADSEVNDYVRKIGTKLAKVGGRDEFEYEFYIIMDDRLNAFALPGGKIFINAGALMKTDSEAELAGLLAHELSHTILSHSFQIITEGNFTANLGQFIPYVGSTAANLLVLNYSRDMERQADEFGTRMLAASGYAADGLRNLMVILDRQKKTEGTTTPPEWLSTHPDTENRIKYIEERIIKNNFNRYTYEGVGRHKEIKKHVNRLWQKYQESEEYRLRNSQKKS
jgi:predicted Zn-dependent protease